MPPHEIEPILARIPELAGRLDQLRITPLAGGMTNRNVKIESDSDAFVLRMAGKNTALLGIQRLCEAACTRAAASVGVGPEVIAYLPDQGVLVTRFLPGKVLTPSESCEPAVMHRIVTTLLRYHGSPEGSGSFCPFRTVRNYYALAAERGVVFPDTMKQALKLLCRLEDALVSNDPACLCHNDLLPGNFIDDGETARLIDWEYAGMGDRYFDLANLAVNHTYDDEQERRLLQLYFGTVDEQRLQRLRMMRLVSDMREAMWGFLQAAISTLEFDFYQYGHQHLQRFLAGCRKLGLQSV